LDGSENFAAGIPLFAVAVAGGKYRRGDLEDLTAMALKLPASGDLFTAEVGAGAMHNGAPVRPPGEGPCLALVELGSSFPPASVDAPRALGCKIRSIGCATLGVLYAALGRAALFLDLRFRLGVWDVAPGLVAGRLWPEFKAVVTRHGERRNRVSIVAGRGGLVDAIIKLI